MSLKDDMEKVQQKVEAIEQESFALSILSDFKKLNKRMFIVLMTVITLWFTTIGYLVYILNDIGVIEETNTNTQEISNVETIDSSYIINGDNYGENKTN